MNLLAETIEAIASSGHSPDDIVFIGSLDSGHRCTWAEFQQLADFDYDAGFGVSEIATDLTVVFRDGQTMWRHDYDGSEWWAYRPPPRIPSGAHPIRTLGGPGAMWVTLAELNEEDGDATS
jgi:hypothetical protein